MVNDFEKLFDPYQCRIVIEPHLRATIKELIESIGFGNRQLLVVCDKATHAALGKEIIRALGSNFLILDGTPHADSATVESVRAAKADAYIAVGSGTINDICKYASFLERKEYAVFPTAPSMNGYFSANASITKHGHKLSLPAHLPKGIFCDLDVLTHAPKRLIASGLGDSLCRPTAQSDWLLSHMLWDTAYDPHPFALLAPYEKELFTHSGKLMSGDLRVIELLVKTLLVSGLGMVLARGSYPASQGEHLIAHTMEMKHGAALAHSYHGEQIGVCTLAMANIQQQLLSQNLQLRKLATPEKNISGYFGDALAESVCRSYRSKQDLYEQYHTVNTRLQAEASTIHDAIQAVTLPESFLRKVLTQAQSPTEAKDIGWKETDFRAAITHARFIRDRFTFIDVLAARELPGLSAQE